MANVTVNVGELYNRKVRMQQIGEALISCTDEVVNAANSVSTGWTGVNSQEYVNSFNDFKPSILRKCSSILAIANGLNQTADIISKLQQDTNVKINSLGSFESSSGVRDSSGVASVRDGEVIGYTQGETFKADKYGENYTNEEFIQLAAIVGGEDSGSYEGALAVASTMCNRADAGIWGGSDPLTVAKAENQFVAYNGELYNKYMADPSSMPDHVIQATKDALAGIRNTTADSFRSFEKSGEVCTQIGTNGNYYFQA